MASKQHDDLQLINEVKTLIDDVLDKVPQKEHRRSKIRSSPKSIRLKHEKCKKNRINSQSVQKISLL